MVNSFILTKTFDGQFIDDLASLLRQFFTVVGLEVLDEALVALETGNADRTFELPVLGRR